jgi:pimeloyl-ACP methyl ester carboxylesterase
MRKREICIRGGNFIYDDSEAEGLQPLVFFHGLPGFHQDLSREARVVLEQSFRVISFDRLGYGENKHLPLLSDLEEQAEFYHRLFESLELGKVILLGHSWAAGLVLELAYDFSHSVSGAVFLAPWCFERPGDRAPTVLLKMGQIPLLGSLALGFISKTIGRRALQESILKNFAPFKLSERLLKTALKEASTLSSFRAILSDKKALIDAFSQLSSRLIPPEVRVWIFSGDKDEVLSYETQALRLHQSLSQSEIHLIPEAGHSLPQSDCRWAQILTQSFEKENKHVANY